jgi:signal transduction histidine kinase
MAPDPRHPAGPAAADRSGRWQPWAILAGGLALTAALAWYVHGAARERERLRFRAEVVQARGALRDRLETHAALLRGARGLFTARGAVAPEEFARYVRQLDLRRRYPGVQGIGWSARIRAGEADSAVAAMRRRLPDFSLWPASAPERHAIVYLEPLDARNRAAIGFNMFSHPVRREAMARARDTGAAAASGRVVLVQEITPAKQAGFLIYLPLYAGSPRTAEERRAALRGFVYSPFRAGDLLRGVLGDPDEAQLALAVYDGDPAERNLLYASHDAPPRGLTATSRFVVAGRPWTIRLAALPGMAFRGPDLGPVVAVGGVLLTVLLTSAYAGQLRARSEAERTAADLRLSEERLLASEERLREEMRTTARLYREAEAARLDAEAANRAKDQFVTVLSHELRTPLSAMLGWTRLLGLGGLDEAGVRNAVDVLDRNARVQLQLVDDLLDLSRIESGRLEIRREEVDVARPVEAALEMVKPAAEQRRVRLDAALERGAVVNGDPRRLEQIAWNLLSNAIKFTDAGGTVSVRLERAETSVRLRVTDTGRGIAREFLPHVFEPYRQEGSARGRRHGLGLGLSIVHHLVQLHGGGIEAASEGENRGATFTVRLPLAADSPGGWLAAAGTSPDG